MEVRHGEPRLQLQRRFEHSSTAAIEESQGSAGLRLSAPRTQTKQLPAEDTREESDMASKSQWSVPHVKPWPGTHRERGSQAVRETSVPQSSCRNEGDTLHMWTTWEAGPWSGCLESSFSQPVLQPGLNEIVMMLLIHDFHQFWTTSCHCFHPYDPLLLINQCNFFFWGGGGGLNDFVFSAVPLLSFRTQCISSTYDLILIKLQRPQIAVS